MYIERMNVRSLPLPEAVIFDFDGVIVDTEPLHYKAFLAVLDPLGMGFPWKEYVSTYMGFDDRDAFREAFRVRGKPLDEERLASLVTAKSGIFLEIIRDGVAPYRGVLPMIASLHASGIPLAISSGALRTDVAPILQRLGIEGSFAVTVTADDVRKSKPDPESYALAFRRLSTMLPSRVTAPGRSFAVEDTPAGIRSAKGAGLRVLAVTNSYAAGDLAGADWIVDSLEDVRIA
jgi:beta-phosphoglucomutase